MSKRKVVVEILLDVDRQIDPGMILTARVVPASGIWSNFPYTYLVRGPEGVIPMMADEVREIDAVELLARLMPDIEAKKQVRASLKAIWGL